LPVIEIHHHKALEIEALGDDEPGDATGTVRLRAIVLRDGAAAGDAAVELHVEKTGLQHVAADIVEIDVDAFRARSAQRLAELAGLVVDRSVEAELLLEEAALLLAAGNADDAAAFDLRDLADEHADRSGSGGDHHRLTCLRPCAFEQPEIGGEAG